MNREQAALDPQADRMEPAIASGRGWFYRDGYLINEFLGRVGHTPAWIVEIEGRGAALPRASGLWARLRAYRRTPRIVQRNHRRLAFVWPLLWPPPGDDLRARMRAQALDSARRWGPPVDRGCGVCGIPWEGGPTLVRARARHLCPACAERIAEAADEQPPGPLTTWLWCIVAGICGLLLQLLFHQSWTVIPLAVVAGWLMGTANAPNFERHPVASPLVTAALLGLMQISGWALITGTQLGAVGAAQLGMIFLWTLWSLPPGVVAGFGAGTLGMGMAILEHRLQQP